jgi:hypothetical protein
VLIEGAVCLRVAAAASRIKHDRTLLSGAAFWRGIAALQRKWPASAATLFACAAVHANVPPNDKRWGGICNAP